MVVHDKDHKDDEYLLTRLLFRNFKFLILKCVFAKIFFVIPLYFRCRDHI